jgi:hypothetical protein
MTSVYNTWTWLKNNHTRCLLPVAHYKLLKVEGWTCPSKLHTQYCSPYHSFWRSNQLLNHSTNSLPNRRIYTYVTHNFVNCWRKTIIHDLKMGERISFSNRINVSLHLHSVLSQTDVYKIKRLLNTVRNSKTLNKTNKFYLNIWNLV